MSISGPTWLDSFFSAFSSFRWARLASPPGSSISRILRKEVAESGVFNQAVRQLDKRARERCEYVSDQRERWTTHGTLYDTRRSGSSSDLRSLPRAAAHQGSVCQAHGTGQVVQKVGARLKSHIGRREFAQERRPYIRIVARLHRFLGGGSCILDWASHTRSDLNLCAGRANPGLCKKYCISNFRFAGRERFLEWGSSLC